MYEHMFERAYECMSICMYEHMYVRMDGWMDGWMDECMYVCMHVYTSIPVVPPSLECPFAPAAFGLAADTAIARTCEVCNYIICMYVYMYVRYEH